MSDGAARLEGVLLLAMDTATPAISVGLAEVAASGVRVLSERVTVNDRAHGELLAPHIDAVLAEAGVKPRDLAAIAAGVGPGPYTGLRVGLVTAGTIAAALGIPTYGVCTLDVLGAATTGEALVATDARRREIYWARYHDGTRVDGPHVSKPFAAGVRSAVGEGAHKYAETLGATPTGPLYPPMVHLTRLAAGRVLNRAPSEHLIPLYLRRPDATEPAGRVVA